MKKFNPYLLAFFAILGKSLAFTLGGTEAAVLIALLLKISFDSYLNRAGEAKPSEDLEPLKLQQKATSDRLIQLENAYKLSKMR